MSFVKAAQAATTVELARLLRHGFAPLVTYAVAHGWLPQAAHKETVEAIATVGSVLAVYAWSLIRERRNRSAAEQSAGAGNNGSDSGNGGVVAQGLSEQTSGQEGSARGGEAG